MFFRLRAPQRAQQRGGGVPDRTDAVLILKNGPSQLAFPVCDVLSSGSKAAPNPLLDKWPHFVVSHGNKTEKGHKLELERSACFGLQNHQFRLSSTFDSTSRSPARGTSFDSGQEVNSDADWLSVLGINTFKCKKGLVYASVLDAESSSGSPIGLKIQR